MVATTAAYFQINRDMGRNYIAPRCSTKDEFVRTSSFRPLGPTYG
ncbi:MAG: hypothetical protein ACI9OJ_005170 [Myxococcota bacterium]|jgi:hypothetical protein